jgi:hypothetical protein
MFRLFHRRKTLPRRLPSPTLTAPSTGAVPDAATLSRISHGVRKGDLAVNAADTLVCAHCGIDCGQCGSTDIIGLSWDDIRTHLRLTD